MSQRFCHIFVCVCVMSGYSHNFLYHCCRTKLVPRNLIWIKFLHNTQLCVHCHENRVWEMFLGNFFWKNKHRHSFITSSVKRVHYQLKFVCAKLLNVSQVNFCSFSRTSLAIAATTYQIKKIASFLQRHSECDLWMCANQGMWFKIAT